MTNKLKWRLTKLPSVEELQLLINDKIISKEEARDILFNEVEEGRDTESLKEEVKFLKELVSKLSSSRSQIVETIRYVEKPYYQYDWYKPYVVYTSASNQLGTLTTSGTASITNAAYTMTSDASGSLNLLSTTIGSGSWDSPEDFSQLQTF